MGQKKRPKINVPKQTKKLLQKYFKIVESFSAGINFADQKKCMLFRLSKMAEKEYRQAS